MQTLSQALLDRLPLSHEATFIPGGQRSGQGYTEVWKHYLRQIQAGRFLGEERTTSGEDGGACGFALAGILAGRYLSFHRTSRYRHRRAAGALACSSLAGLWK